MHHRASNLSRWLVALSFLLVGLVVAIAIAAALAPTLLPAGDRTGGEGRGVAAGVIFAASYLALAIGRIPGLSIDRAGIALVGAGLMVASGALTLEDAYKAGTSTPSPCCLRGPAVPTKRSRRIAKAAVSVHPMWTASRAFKCAARVGAEGSHRPWRRG
jgi:hypothetical protein